MNTNKATATATRRSSALARSAAIKSLVVGSTAKPRVRDRIFDTACALFYRHGIRAVGVDAIADAAGTNKMSFYRSFASKDELVAQYLSDRDREYWQWWDAVLAPYAGQPRKQVEVLFESCVSKTCAKDSLGCPIANAAVELKTAAHPGRKVLLAHKAEMRRRLRKLARQMRAREADSLGDALMLLLEGGNLTRLTFDKAGPISASLKAAKALMNAHLAQ